MARTVVFDPTERELFDDQRQRFDWTLLQTGFVFRYATRFQLDSACKRLTDLGYLVRELDAQEWIRPIAWESAGDVLSQEIDRAISER